MKAYTLLRYIYLEVHAHVFYVYLNVCTYVQYLFSNTHNIQAQSLPVSASYNLSNHLYHVTNAESKLALKKYV